MKIASLVFRGFRMNLCSFSFSALVALILFSSIAISSAQFQLRRRFRFLRQSNNNNELQEQEDFVATLPRILDSSCLNQSQSDIHLTSAELIKKKGFPFEAHKITSEDGYILELHRIPGPENSKPILLVHGMTQSSRDFLMNCGKKALAYKLADEGFDVWLANIRGNQYSAKHKTLSRNDAQFWNFTVDDVIKYDAPIMVDYILHTTHQPKLTWIGYSLGTAIAMGLLSSQPKEYNPKIELFVSLGTIAYVGNTSGRILRLVARYHRGLQSLLTRTNNGKLLPDSLIPTLQNLIPLICLPETTLNIPGLCNLFLGTIFRFNYHQVNPQLITILSSGTPNQWSVKLLAQWFQWIESGQFSYYDYGKKGNLIKYGQEIPPNYNLTQVTSKVVNFWSENDNTAVPKDVNKVITELPNVVANIRIPARGWTHLDFVYGRDADKFVYDEIIKAIHQFT